MKTKLTSFVPSAEHMQLVLVIVSLVMLVLGVGAPLDGGGGR